MLNGVKEMSIDAKNSKPVLGKKGLTYKGDLYDYPIKVGKLKTYRNVFNDVVIELYRKGNKFRLNFYDKKKGLIGVAKIAKLDAYYLVLNQLAKGGFNGEVKLSPEEFRDMTRGLDMIFIDQ
jgi:hypothetical protein